MAEVSGSEIKKTMATSLGTAFGIVIGMVVDSSCIISVRYKRNAFNDYRWNMESMGYFRCHGFDCNNNMCCGNCNAKQMGGKAITNLSNPLYIAPE
jgi:hypothetical protein